jgi:undecaprenyl-diphosphatase
MSKLHAGIYILFLALFGLLGYLAHQLPYFPGDVSISLWLQRIDLPFFSPLMTAVSFISSMIPAAIVVALLAIGLWLSGRKLEPVFMASLTSFAALLNWLLKLIISRPRPSSELILVIGENNGLSFPSGHVVYAVVFYGLLFYLATRLVKSTVAVGTLRVVLILLIILTGVSRIYLGAHWFSDVLGSSLLGGLLLAPTIALYHRYAISRQRTRGDINA